MDLQLAGKRVLVTGGSRGIGFATTRTFLEEGANVLICGRGEDDLKTAARSLADAGLTPPAHVVADVTTREGVESLAEATLDILGGIDVLVHNAGTGIYKSFFDVTEDDLRFGMDINFIGPYLLTQRLAPAMVEQGSGVIITVGGGSGVRTPHSPFNSTASGPAKAAQLRWTSALAGDLGKRGIRVNSVVPGLVLTERSDRWRKEFGTSEGIEDPEELRRHWGRFIERPNHEWARPQDIANFIVFASSPRAQHLNGASIHVDGGENKVI